MSLFKKKQKPTRWSLVHQKNELTGSERWVVYHRLIVSVAFDNYDDAFAFYADKVGWKNVEYDGPDPLGGLKDHQSCRRV